MKSTFYIKPCTVYDCSPLYFPHKLVTLSNAMDTSRSRVHIRIYRQKITTPKVIRCSRTIGPGDLCLEWTRLFYTLPTVRTTGSLFAATNCFLVSTLNVRCSECTSAVVLHMILNISLMFVTWCALFSVL